MLEQLFGSRTRTLILRLFLDHPDNSYYFLEIARLIGTQLHSVRRELDNLEQFGLLLSIAPSQQKEIKETEGDGEEKKDGESQKKYYSLDKTFVLYPELRALFL